MPRLLPVDPNIATGKARVLLDQVRTSLGTTPNMMRTMAHSPAVLEGYLALAGALAKGRLPARLREQVALAVGEANRCEYCVSAHSALGKRAGLTEAEVALSREGRASDPRAAVALAFVQGLVERAGEVTDVEIEQVRDAGFEDAEIAEMVAHVALNVFTNYFNKVAGTEVDFPRVPFGVAAPRS